MTELVAEVEYFRCVPLAATLRRRECASRFTVAPTKPVGQRGPCMECPIGRAHKAGERHPDAPRVEAPRTASGAVAQAFSTRPGPDEARRIQHAEHVAAGVAKPSKHRSPMPHTRPPPPFGAEPRKVVCDTCNDTHVMALSDRQAAVPCTSCPTPCEECRQHLGAFCRETPCSCVCHAKKLPEKVARSDARLIRYEGREQTEKAWAKELKRNKKTIRDLNARGLDLRTGLGSSGGRPARLIPYEGREQTADAWAKELKRPLNLIWHLAKYGHDLRTGRRVTSRVSTRVDTPAPAFAPLSGLVPDKPVTPFVRTPDFCPNCERPHAGLYTSETGVRHCGCYYEDPKARHTFERDARLIEMAAGHTREVVVPILLEMTVKIGEAIKKLTDVRDLAEKHTAPKAL